MLTTSARESATAWFQAISDLLNTLRVTDLKGEGVENGLGKAVDILQEARAAGKKAMIIGNGGSAAIASHQAIDFWKCGGLPTLTFNDSAQLTCLSNDYGYEHVFSKPIEVFGQPGDVVIAISSGGRSPNILNGAKSARERGCAVLTLAGFTAEAPLLSLGDLNFYIDSVRYGHVEIAHLAIIHYFTDVLGESNPAKC